MSIDWKRDYGTVYGMPGRVRYEQDGRYFDVEGVAVNETPVDDTQTILPIAYETLPLTELQNMLMNRASSQYPTRRSVPHNRDTIVAALRNLDG